ncbi:MAG: stage III sporulation protein AA [Eubacteriaceae bacterium]|nr:stage III sporulation protein AA [Eubacteriaceae bacterium]
MDFGIIEEIRIRAGKEMEVVASNQCFYIKEIFGQEDILLMLQNGAKQSLYAHAEQLKQGFLTIQGGHRIGVCGRVHHSNGVIESIDSYSSLNIRVARQILGVSKDFVRLAFNDAHKPCSLLIVSAPGVGKTTLLRDLARVISDGGHKVGIVDERGEIAACVQGVPTLEVGMRTDVMDNCPKAVGMRMLIRSMSPELIVTDEIAGDDDQSAVVSAISSGVSVLASAHGSTIEELSSRQYLHGIVQNGLFDRIVFMARGQGVAIPMRAYDSKLRRI